MSSKTSLALAPSFVYTNPMARLFVEQTCFAVEFTSELLTAQLVDTSNLCFTMLLQLNVHLDYLLCSL